jgi:phosphonate transport system substrate-binding protein
MRGLCWSARVSEFRLQRLTVRFGLLCGGIFFGAMLIAGCQSEVTSPAAPKRLRFAITDVEGLEQLQREFGAFRELLEKETKLSIELFPVSDRTAAVVALENNLIDLVLTGPAEYVIFRSRTKVEPLVGLYRPDYTAVILVRQEDNYRSLQDLRGKRIAMGSIASTSKHLAPMHMLSEAGIGPGEIEPFHTGIRAGWETLLRGDVAAFATTKDKYLLLMKEDESVNVTLLAESSPLPMDVLLARHGLSTSVTDAITAAIDTQADAFVDAILKGDDNQKYRGMEFRSKITDADYDDVRQMFRSAGLEQLATTSR